MKRHAPATARNRTPILEVLRRVLPVSGEVLEVASGTGEHAAFLAAQMPGLTWQPSDAEPAALESIRAHAEDSGLSNLRAPLELDVTARWPLERADAVVCINLIHIAPWEACEGLMAGAARILPRGGPLYLYGPYFVQGRPTAPSNEAFDQSLRMQDPSWGVRRLGDVEAAAGRAGFVLEETVDMPANNFSVVFRRG